MDKLNRDDSRLTIDLRGKWPFYKAVSVCEMPISHVICTTVFNLGHGHTLPCVAAPNSVQEYVLSSFQE